MKTNCLIIILLLSSIITKAQNVFSGKIFDASNKHPLASATLVYNKKIIATTNEQGFFYFTYPAETIDINTSLVGYNTQALVLKSKKFTEISLAIGATLLQDVVVLSNNKLADFTTLSKADLNIKPVKNTQELLRVVPGLFIAQHAGGGKAEQIFLRGFDADHGTDIAITVDGMPVNMVSHAHGQGYADAHFIIPETINKIDFGVGPYNANQGNLNTAGYVNFSTYQQISTNTIQLERGQYNTSRALVMLDLLKKNKAKEAAYIAAEYNYTDGPTINKQYFNRLNIFGKYALQLSQSLQLTASASAFKSNWDASGQIPERAVADGSIDRFGSIDPTEGGNTERYNINVVLTKKLGNNTDWINQAFYSKYHFNLFSNFTFFLNNSTEGDQIQQVEARNLFGLKSSVNTSSKIQNTIINSQYGIGIRYDAINNSALSNTVRRAFIDDRTKGNITEANTYAYTKQQVTFGKLLIDAGLRLDHFYFNYNNLLSNTQLAGKQKAIISPKLNTQYTFNNSLQAFIKLGKGFHSNDTRVVVANEGREILPAAYGADIGIIIKPSKNLFISGAVWYLHLNQEFVYVGDEGVIEPSGKSKRMGIDVITRYQLNKNLYLNVNINLTQPRALGVNKGEDFIPLAPTVTSVGGIYYKRKNGINGGINYRYIKDRAADETKGIIAKGYCLFDAAINYTNKKYEIGLLAENLFNITWNEAQFATTSRLQQEAPNSAVTELHFTPGTPFFLRAKLAIFF